MCLKYIHVIIIIYHILPPCELFPSHTGSPRVLSHTYAGLIPFLIFPFLPAPQTAQEHVLLTAHVRAFSGWRRSSVVGCCLVFTRPWVWSPPQRWGRKERNEERKSLTLAKDGHLHLMTTLNFSTWSIDGPHHSCHHGDRYSVKFSRDL